ncbi:MAG: ATP-dependent DNA helicase [DPANN group archaeon]|nr:ATP-dependent DNA helicase [DPANN group archaeon]
MQTLFPFDKTRPGQIKFMDDVYKCLSAKKNYVVHAPTGIGKTVSALAPAVKYALENNKTVVFLTPRHMQHKIVVDTLKAIKAKNPDIDISVANIVGKRWLCALEDAKMQNSENLSEMCKKLKGSEKCSHYKKIFKKGGDLSPVAVSVISELKEHIMTSEDAKDICLQNELCPYEILMQYLKDSNVIIADYYHMLHPFVQKMFLSKLEKDMGDIILVIDEAHNVPGRVRELMSSHLTSDVLDKAIKESDKFNFQDISKNLRKFRNILNEYCITHTGKEDEKLAKKEFLVKIVKDVYDDFNQFVNELVIAGDIVTNERKISYIGGVGKFLLDWCGLDLGFVRIVKTERNIMGVVGFEVCYDCLDPSMLTKNLFEKLHSVILMSGTLTPVDMFMEVLGLNKMLTESLVLDSPFPRENCLILIKDDVTTKFTERSEEQSYKIAGNIVKVINNTSGNLGVFFPSYSMLNTVYELMAQFTIDKEILLEARGMTKNDKKMLFNKFASFVKTDKSAALFAVVGANFSEGVDFPGEIMNGVVVVGLPLERPDIKNQALINYYEMKFKKGWDYGYTYPAMNKVMQTAGRCIRSETDRGVIVLMDKRFLWNPYRGLLPREAQIYISGDLSAELYEFYRI